MRRFELVEGTSSKFWEIRLEGSAFTVTFGRIGTAGQTQQKSLADAEKAQKEHDKLVAEKLKKGYVEVGAAGAALQAAAVSAAAPAAPSVPAPVRKKAAAPAQPAAAQPAPAPVEPAEAPATPATPATPAVAAVAPAPGPSAVGAAPAAPPDTVRGVVWDEAYVRQVYARRGGVPVPVRAPSPARKAWGAVKEAWAERVGQVLAGLKRKGPPLESAFAEALRGPGPRLALAERVQALAARLEGQEPCLGAHVEEDAALLALLQHSRTWGERTQEAHAVDLLVTLGGPAYATRAALLAAGLGVDGRDRQPLVLAPSAEIRMFRGYSTDALGCLTRLREVLARHTDEAAYAGARDAAEPFAHGGTDDQRLGATFLFPTEHAWTRACQGHTGGSTGQLFLLLSAADAGLVARIAPNLDGWVFSREPAVLPTLLDGAGLGALPLLQELAGKLGTSEVTRAWADALSRLDADEALELLFDKLARETAPFAIEAALRWPERGLRLLAPRVAVRGKAGELPRQVLAALVRRLPAAVDAALPGLPEELHRAVAAVREGAGPDAPEADPGQLPPVLASPPWLDGKGPATLPVLEGVQVPAPPDAMAWREGEREAWAAQRGSEPAWAKQVTFSALDARAWEAFRKQPPTDEQLGAAFFVFAPEDLALAHLPRFRPDRWWDRDWMPPIVGRLGLAALPLALAAVERGVASPGELLLPFGSASLAPRMADLFAHSRKGRSEARGWLLRHPAHAVAGLLPQALGKKGRDKDAAVLVLRMLAAAGHHALVLEAAGRASPEVRRAAEALLSLDPLRLFPARLPKLPDFFRPASLPAVLLRDGSARLPPAALEALGVMLAFHDADAPYPGLLQVKEACDGASLARFAWGLFEAWELDGAASKEGWAFRALGVLGDDEVARRLAPRIREWPGESQHQRAVTGLDVLAAIGTDVTLVYLNGIAEKVKFKGLQAKAQEKIAEIAEGRGLTREELADRLVPDLGLTADGTLPLSFGERTFTVGFDETLKPYVRDAEGARLKDLPKPTKRDDAQLAAAAEERWKALKKDAKVVAGTQVLRLELAMCSRRRWSAGVFRRFFVEHPLLVHVVRRLVWGTYGEDGRLTHAFRVAEDRTFADAGDDTFALPEDATVGLPHALELDAGAAAAFGQLLADYQLLQPFAQLGRQTFAPEGDEVGGKELARVKGLKLPTGKVLGLEARGWRRGEPQDAGVVCWMEKPVGGTRVAMLDLDPGLYTGSLADSPEQVLGTVVVQHGDRWGRGAQEPLSALDAIVFSELVRDLEGLRG
jgi:predicted DNA-binding WGR domain protein